MGADICISPCHLLLWWGMTVGMRRCGSVTLPPFASHKHCSGIVWAAWQWTDWFKWSYGKHQARHWIWCVSSTSDQEPVPGGSWRLGASEKPLPPHPSSLQKVSRVISYKVFFGVSLCGPDSYSEAFRLSCTCCFSTRCRRWKFLRLCFQIRRRISQRCWRNGRNTSPLSNSYHDTSKELSGCDGALCDAPSDPSLFLVCIQKYPQDEI